MGVQAWTDVHTVNSNFVLNIFEILTKAEYLICGLLITGYSWTDQGYSLSGITRIDAIQCHEYDWSTQETFDTFGTNNNFYELKCGLNQYVKGIQVKYDESKVASTYNAIYDREAIQNLVGDQPFYGSDECCYESGDGVNFNDPTLNSSSGYHDFGRRKEGPQGFEDNLVEWYVKMPYRQMWMVHDFKL